MQTNNTCLVTCLHDPGNKLNNEEYFKAISLYDYSVVSVSPDTTLKREYFNKIVINNNLADARYSALETAYNYSDCAFYHYVDFDRLVYWQMNYPNELKQVIERIQEADFTILGRTPAAFDSHPDFQKQTENVCNLLFSIKTGLTYDMLSGSRGISRKAAKLILDNSNVTNGATTDIEWALIVKQNMQYLEVNGLAYEHALLGLEKSPQSEINTRIKNMIEICQYLEKQ